MRVVVACALIAACGRSGFTNRDGAADGVDLDADQRLPGLTAWYRMEDDPSDGTIDDGGGSNRVARCVVGVSCPTATPGHLGKALAFDGTQYARVAYGEWLATPTAWSFAAWIYIDTLVDQVPFAKPYGTGILDSWDVVAWNNGNGTCVESINGAATTDSVCASALPAGRWFHVAGRWDGQAKALFIDGIKAGELPSTASMFDTHDVVLGCDENNGSQAYCWHGKLDELQLYDRALADGEILMLSAR